MGREREERREGNPRYIISPFMIVGKENLLSIGRKSRFKPSCGKVGQLADLVGVWVKDVEVVDPCRITAKQQETLPAPMGIDLVFSLFPDL